MTFNEILLKRINPDPMIQIGMRLPANWDTGVTVAGITRFSIGDAPEISPVETLRGGRRERGKR